MKKTEKDIIKNIYKLVLKIDSKQAGIIKLTI